MEPPLAPGGVYLYAPHAVASLVDVLRNSVNNPQWYWNSTVRTFTPFPDPFGCSVAPQYRGNVAGKIALIINNGCSIQDINRMWQAENVLGIVAAHPDLNMADITASVWDYSDTSSFTVPFVIVSWQYPPTVTPKSMAEWWGGTLLFFMFTGQNVSFRYDVPQSAGLQLQFRTVTLLSAGKWTSWTLALIAICFSVARLVAFISHDGGLRPTIHQIMFTLNIISLTFLIVGLTLGWLFFDLYQPWGSLFLYSHFLPYSMGAQFVLAFYWLEVALFHDKKSSPVLFRLAIPCYLLVFVTWVMEVTQGGLVANRMGVWLQVIIATWSFYIATASVLIILLVIGGCLVLIRLVSAPATTAKLRRMGIKVSIFMALNLVSPAMIIAWAAVNIMSYQTYTQFGNLFFLLCYPPSIAALVCVAMFSVKSKKELEAARSGDDTGSTRGISKMGSTSNMSSSAASSASRDESQVGVTSGVVEL